MSTVEQGNSVRSEFIEKLSSQEEAVTINYLLNETSVESRREAKRILRTMIDQGMISTTPGFKYRLASDVSATA